MKNLPQCRTAFCMPCCLAFVTVLETVVYTTWWLDLWCPMSMLVTNLYEKISTMVVVRCRRYTLYYRPRLAISVLLDSFLSAFWHSRVHATKYWTGCLIVPSGTTFLGEWLWPHTRVSPRLSHFLFCSVTSCGLVLLRNLSCHVMDGWIHPGSSSGLFVFCILKAPQHR